MTQVRTTGRKVKIVATISGYDNIETAQAAKKSHEEGDVWTYHVVRTGDVYILALIIDEQGREVKRLRSTDELIYRA